jgi:predicted nucleic acid-binding Zn ribbon protein
MTEQQPTSGRDLARLALANYKATAAKNPGPARKKPTRRRAMQHGGGRDPIGLGTVLERINVDQEWNVALAGGNIVDQWPTICPMPTGTVDAVAFDAERGRLDLRPASHAYAAQLRLLGGQLAKQVNDKLGRDIVRSIRVLPVGNVASAPQQHIEAPRSAEPTAPVRTRETASAGYRQALEAFRANKPAEPAVNPYVAAARARQEAALANPSRREPETEFTDGVAALERITPPDDDRSEAVRQAAIARKHRGDAPVRRAFDVA